MKAIIFPGQGAQYTGMGKSFYDSYPNSKKVFDTVDDVLGFKLSEKCFTASAQDLKDTAIAQLAILVSSVAAYEAFNSKGIKPDYLAGLSLGEYSCLYAADVLSLKDLAILVRERATAMQEAALLGSSTMFAIIGADIDFLKEQAPKSGFHIANINSPSQTVVSLAIDKKDEVKAVLEPKAMRVIELEVSGGFHSPFMDSAKERLSKVIKDMKFNDAKIPIVSNFTAKSHINSEEIKNNLLEQLTSSVLWNGCINYMSSKGVDLFFEIGPSKVLKGLMRKINSKLKVVNIEKKEDLDVPFDQYLCVKEGK